MIENVDIQFVMEVILPKMFEMVGLPTDEAYITDYTSQIEWYTKVQWTQEQEQEFINWLTNIIKKKFKCNKKIALKNAKWFNLAYGWKISRLPE